MINLWVFLYVILMCCMPMQDQKIKRLVSLTEDIKQKVEKVLDLNERISVFNFKLEALLASVDEYSTLVLGPESDQVEELNASFSDLKFMPHVTQNAPSREEKMEKRSAVLEKPISVDELLERIYTIIPDNALYRSSTEKLVRFLFSNKNGVLHDEILKKSGVSKYRCIEILNLLMNVDPPIVNKTVDRGFVYRLSIFTAR